ncbi:MAG: PilZ domain-containing protein [Candidatus Omnitrophica bacterium]|nr:PilZ domain-containing protein [Candidatus Omnitrophota bacterium]
MTEHYDGEEKRLRERFECMTPLAYKICSQETLSKLFKGYTINVSETGLLCNIHDSVKVEDVLWLSFNKSVLELCAELDRHSFFYQNGVVGKVVRVEDNRDGTFNVGIHFITREEQNLTNIYPKIHFLEGHEKGTTN